MNTLQNVVIYQTQNGYGFCKAKEREKTQYEYNITPTRFSLIKATNDCLEVLFDLADNDVEEFIEIIKSELENTLSIYSN